MFYRVSTAVISPSLVQDLGFTSGQLSDLSAVFFYAFAFSQIPMGVALDRYGTRITLFVLSIFGVSGAILFSIGETPNHLIVARTLLGIGVSGNLMVLLTLFAEWFPVNRFGFLTGMVVSIGVLGNLLAATPLALMNHWIGWRSSFLIFALVDAAIVIIFLLIARERPAGSQKAMRSDEMPNGLYSLIRTYGYWAISLCSFVRYGYFAALQGLWIAPFLIYGLGLTEIAAGNALFVMGLGYMIALPLGGSLSDLVLRSRRQVVILSMSLMCLLTFSIALWTKNVPMWLVMATMFGLGFSSAPGNIAYAHMKELLPPEMAARALTAVNLFTVLGAGVITHILGIAVGPEPAKLTCPEDFRALWLIGGFSIALVVAVYYPVQDSNVLKQDRS
jgi:MFS family permease